MDIASPTISCSTLCRSSKYSYSMVLWFIITRLSRTLLFLPITWYNSLDQSFVGSWACKKFNSALLSFMKSCCEIYVTTGELVHFCLGSEHLTITSTCTFCCCVLGSMQYGGLMQYRSAPGIFSACFYTDASNTRGQCLTCQRAQRRFIGVSWGKDDG